MICYGSCGHVPIENGRENECETEMKKMEKTNTNTH